jgi:hypothetical protein
VPFWAFFIVAGAAVLFYDKASPWWTQYPIGAGTIIVGGLCLLNYGLLSSVCITPHEFQWNDWFGLRSFTVPLGAITAVVEERRRTRYSWLHVAVVRWRGGQLDLSPHIWRKSNIRELISIFEKRIPTVEVEASVRDLLTGTDYWVKR